MGVVFREGFDSDGDWIHFGDGDTPKRESRVNLAGRFWGGYDSRKRGRKTMIKVHPVGVIWIFRLWFAKILDMVSRRWCWMTLEWWALGFGEWGRLTLSRQCRRLNRGACFCGKFREVNEK
jgi:hypothetical protein